MLAWLDFACVKSKTVSGLFVYKKNLANLMSFNIKRVCEVHRAVVKSLYGFTALALVLYVSSGGAWAQEIAAQPDDAALAAPDDVQESNAIVASQPTLPSHPGGLKVDAEKPSPNKAPVDLQADQLQHDESGQKITASGEVVLMQAGRTVKADQIVYDLREDTVVATGHVEFTDINGDKHYADKVEFNDTLKNGFVQGLQTYLVDGSRFNAKTGTHTGGTKTVMADATYTPCDPCKNDPEGAPLWQIRAADVIHDKEKKSIAYKHARFEVKGVPVAYVPYFSHPDGSVKRKSGFLTPSAGFKSETGAFVESAYYWSIAPDKDMTVGVRAMTEEAPLLMTEWRQRWERAQIIARGSITHSDRKDQSNGQTVQYADELRGNLKLDGTWDINNKWRSGVKVDVASDDQFLRQYDIEGDDDVLQNEAYVERFSGRNYASARMLAFQDLRIEEDRDDQPHVLPEIEASFLGEPDSVPLIGGRWSVDSSLLSLFRPGDEQDMNRVSTALGWQRRLVSDYGLLTTVNARLRGDAYAIGDSYATGVNANVDDNTTKTRGFGYVHAVSSYPVAKPVENAQVVVEPLVALTMAPNVGNDKVPNEDSQDVQIDTSNLFEANRFPGLDRVEDQSHVTYGMKTGVYAYDGSFGDIFIGQSYRFDDDDNPYTRGSGLDQQGSDVVGQISAGYKDMHRLDYSFQLDNESLSSQRHEVDASVRVYDLTLSGRYLYAKGLGGTDIEQTREQIQSYASYDLNDQWRVFGGAHHDLGVDPGLRSADFGFDYMGQCISFSATATRTLTSEASGDSGTEVMFRLGLKNLGEFQSSGLSLGSNQE